MTTPDRRVWVALGVTAIALLVLGVAVASPGSVTSRMWGGHGAAMDPGAMHAGGTHPSDMMGEGMMGGGMHPGGSHGSGMMGRGMHGGSCQNCTEPGTDANATQVMMRDSTFDPQTVTVRVGQSVEWVNADDYGHTVTSDDGRFGSGVIPPGQAWTYTFTEPGTYTYHCQPHSAREGEGYEGMVGTIVVEG